MGQRSAVTADAKTIDAREIARDLAGTAATAAAHARPTADDWCKLLQKAAVYASIGVAWGLSKPGPYNENFEMSDIEAEDISSPIAREIARSKFNQRYGHLFMRGGEYMDAIAAAVAYGTHIAPGVRAKVSGSQPPPAPPRSVSNVNTRRPDTRAQESPTIIYDTSEHTNGNGAGPRVVSSAPELPIEPPPGIWSPEDHTSHRPD